VSLPLPWVLLGMSHCAYAILFLIFYMILHFRFVEVVT
jgi:hypothetical protein